MQQPNTPSAGELRARDAKKEASREAKKAARKSAKAAGKMGKAFAVNRIKKCKTNSAISNLSKHNLRNGKEYPDNANPDMADQNKVWLKGNAETLLEAVENRLQDMDGEPRKNAVKMIETVLTFSPEAEPEDLDQWYKDSVKWAQDFYGKNNVVGVQLHMDERTPHLHIQVVPLVEQQRKIRNSDPDNPEYHPPELKLNARHFTGGPQKMRGMQSSYAKAMEKHGLERGISRAKTDDSYIDVRTRRGELINTREEDVASGVKLVMDEERKNYDTFKEENNRRNWDLKQENRVLKNGSKRNELAKKAAQEDLRKAQEKLALEKAAKDTLEEQVAALNNRLNEVDPARQVSNSPSSHQPKPSFAK